MLSFLLGWLSVHSSNKQSNAKKPSLITITHNAVANSRQQQQHTIHKSQAPSANSRAPVATEVYPPFVNWSGSDQWLTGPHVRGTWQFTRSGLGMAWPDTPILLVAICYPVKRTRANTPKTPKTINEYPKRREVHQGHTKKNLTLTTLVETFVAHYWRVMGPCHGHQHQPQVDTVGSRGHQSPILGRPPQPTAVDP